jgi:hypothetical protein
MLSKKYRVRFLGAGYRKLRNVLLAHNLYLLKFSFCLLFGSAALSWQSLKPISKDYDLLYRKME